MGGKKGRASRLLRAGSVRIPDGQRPAEAAHAALRDIQRYQGFCGTDVSPFGLNLK